VSRIPTTANLRRGNEIVTVPVAVVAIGDRMVVRAGEIVPADGALMSADAVMDTAALTGELLPVHLRVGDDVASGSVNAGAAIEVTATRPAEESTYAALVRLVRAAERSQAPFVRMADRYAGWFLPFTLVLAGLGWGLSGDPVRAVAVLVIATPCPLILAAPVALVSGVSPAARAGVIVKGAKVIEMLGAVDTVMLDKTGTLMLGVPVVEQVDALSPLDESELLRLAASADQASAHVMAQALVADARARGLRLTFPTELFETPGQGLRGLVGGRTVAVGSSAFLTDLGVDVSAAAEPIRLGVARVLIAVDGVLAGSVMLSDRLRPDAADLARLHAAGVSQVMLVTGRSAIGCRGGGRSSRYRRGVRRDVRSGQDGGRRGASRARAQQADSHGR
jgi:P-type E1-E2 ATPase